MYLKQRDKDILNFIEKWGSANATIIGNLFFSDCKDSYYNASRRLKILCQDRFLKKYRKDMYSKNIYFMGAKPLTEHQIKLLEVYSKLSMLGNTITLEREVSVPCGSKKRKNDGVITLSREDDKYIYEYLFIVEIDLTHDTNTTKINQVAESNYYQNKYDLEPVWIIVKHNEYQKKYYTNSSNIIYVNWNLDELNENIFE